MDAFKTITTRHLELLSQQQSPPPDFLETARQFREEVFSSGREVFAPGERDQLRSILRYWTNYINQNSAEKIYETRDLDEFQGLPKAKRPSSWMWIGGIALVALLAVSIWLIAKGPGTETGSTPPPAIKQTQTPTERLVLPATWTAVVALVPTETPTITPSKLPAMEAPLVSVLSVVPDQSITIQGDNFAANETFQATMVLVNASGTTEVPVGSLSTGAGGTLTESFPIPPELAGAGQLTLRLESKESGLATTATFSNNITAAGPSADFSAPTTGKTIPPLTVFEGPYTNLGAGWTVFLTFEPRTRGSLIFPWREGYTVPENTPDGTWKIEVDLGSQFDLSKPDQYIVDLVVANSDNLRQELISGAKDGLKDLPSEAIRMNKPIVLKREAYKTINEQRLLFSGWMTDKQEQELFSVRLDGSDLTQITFTDDSVEDNPSLSADGRKITFVDTLTHSIWIMDSDGENRVMVYSDPRRTLEGPVFSPDGRYLAFSASEPDYPSNRTTWNIYAIELKSALNGKAVPVVLTKNYDLVGNYLSNRWPSWVDEKSLIYSGFKLQNEFVYQVNLDTLAPLRFYGKIFDRSDVKEVPPIEMPVFFKASESLAFTSNLQDTPHEVFVANGLDSMPIQLTKNRQGNNYPRWSPDGQTIYYSGKDNAIWAINIDGSNEHVVFLDKKTQAMWPWVGKMVAYFLLKP